MPKTRRGESAVVLVVILILGALIGSVIGEVISSLLPGGLLELILSKGVNPGIAPVTLDLKVLTITFGFTVKITLTSLVGIGLAFLISKKL